MLILVLIDQIFIFFWGGGGEGTPLWNFFDFHQQYYEMNKIWQKDQWTNIKLFSG